MKKVMLFALFIATIYACDNEDLNNIESMTDGNATRVITSTENVLSFNSEKDFEQVIKTLSEIEDTKDRKKWVEEHYGEFTSMQAIYDQAMIEAENIGETKEAFMQFKEKYSSLYFPMYKEDCGFYIPVKDLAEASLINADGNVKIAGNIVCKKDVTNYEELMVLGRAYYPMPLTRIVNNLDDLYLLSNGKIIGEDNNTSGWYKENGKKIKVNVRRKCQGNFVYLHTEISFRKHTWLGWTNYSSYTHLTGTVKSYYRNGTQVQSLPMDYEKEADSSHDSYTGPLAIGGAVKDSYQASGTIYTYEIYKIIVNASVTYRGMSTIQTYNFTLPPVTGYTF